MAFTPNFWMGSNSYFVVKARGFAGGHSTGAIIASGIVRNEDIFCIRLLHPYMEPKRVQVFRPPDQHPSIQCRYVLNTPNLLVIYSHARFLI
jgi:hypothetical protein